MDEQELYERRQYTHRRGAQKNRTHTPFDKERKKRRDKIPKWAKEGLIDFPREGAYYWEQFPTEPRRNGHFAERDRSVLNQNKRRNHNPQKQKRKYWKPIRPNLGGKAR